MFSKFLSLFRRGQAVATESLDIGPHKVPLLVVRNPRARRYHLRLRADGSARVTIPRGGSQTEAQAFLDRNRDWIERQLVRLQAQPRRRTAWNLGSEILFRGALVPLQACGDGAILVGTEMVKVEDASADLRPIIERHLRLLAAQELPARVAELAAQHQFSVARVSVRNQKSRWGSCSPRRVISLNWRLIQTPEYVRDYIILHELAHLRQMNHSAAFWQEVQRLCPAYSTAEKWLKTNPHLLRP